MMPKSCANACANAAVAVSLRCVNSCTASAGEPLPYTIATKFRHCRVLPVLVSFVGSVVRAQGALPAAPNSFRK